MSEDWQECNRCGWRDALTRMFLMEGWWWCDHCAESHETIAQRNARLNLTNWRPRAEDAK